MNKQVSNSQPHNEASILNHEAIRAVKTLFSDLSGKTLRVEIPGGSSHLMKLPLADGEVSTCEPERIERAGLARQFPGRNGAQRTAGTRVLSMNSWCEIVRLVEVDGIPLVLLRSGPFSLFKSFEDSENEVLSGPGDFQMIFETEVETLSSLMESLACWLEFEMKYGSEPLEQHLGTAISLACSFISERRRQVLTAQQVSDHIGLSRSHFSLCLSKSWVRPSERYLSRARVTDACRLIEEGRLRMNEIAFEVGFQSVSQFNRNFLAFVGKSPSAYREAFWNEVTPTSADLNQCLLLSNSSEDVASEEQRVGHPFQTKCAKIPANCQEEEVDNMSTVPFLSSGDG